MDRQRFIDWLATQEGVPYLWSGRGTMLGDGSPSPYTGWDCWGLVAGGLLVAGGPDLRSWWTDRAWLELLPVATPLAGDLVFYAPRAPNGPQDVEHVEVVVGPGAPIMLAGGEQSLPGLRTIGAIGGNHLTTTLASAQSQGARVRYRANHLGRPSFAGFRRLELRAP